MAQSIPSASPFSPPLNLHQIQKNTPGTGTANKDKSNNDKNLLFTIPILLMQTVSTYPVHLTK